MGEFAPSNNRNQGKCLGTKLGALHLQQQSLGRIEFGSASPAIHREDTSVTKALGTYSHTGSKLKSDALGSVRRTELAAIKQEITEHRAHSAMLA